MTEFVPDTESVNSEMTDFVPDTKSDTKSRNGVAVSTGLAAQAAIRNSGETIVQ